MNSPKNLRIFHEVGIECVSSTTLIANLIEEETLLGSVSVVSSLTHGNVILTEVGRPAHAAFTPTMPACSCKRHPSAPRQYHRSGRIKRQCEAVNEDTVLFPGDKAIVVADNQVIDAVRAAFKGL